MKSHSIEVGIGTNKNFWSQLFGGLDGCPEVGYYTDLWWEPVGN